MLYFFKERSMHLIKYAITLMIAYTNLQLFDVNILIYCLYVSKFSLNFKFCLYSLIDDIYAFCSFLNISFNNNNNVVLSSADSCRNTHIYTHLPYHNDSIIETDARRKRQEDFFNNIFPLTLLQGFERVVQGLHVRGCWTPNINFIF